MSIDMKKLDTLKRKVVRGEISRRGFLKGLSAMGLAMSSAGIYMPGASAAGKSGGVVKIGLDSTIRNFDYHTIGALSDSWAPSQIFRGLADLDPETLRLVPEQAESWEHNDDFTVWTYHIRKGIRYTNGTEVTAGDVKACTERVADEESGAFYFPSFEGITSIDVVDSHTVRFTMSSPHPRMESLTFVHINALMSPDTFADANTNPIGSGPYKLKEHIPGEVTVLERNEDYWETGLPLLDELHMIPIPDESSRLAALQAGEVDFIRNPPRSQVAALQEDTNLNVQVSAATWVDWFRINMDKPPLDDHRVRLAIAHAINREAANKRALFGLGTPALTSVPPLSNVPLDINPPEYNPDKSRALLKEAGAEGFDLELMAHDVAHIAKTAESFAADLQAVGINAVAKATEDGLWIERWVDRDFQMANSASISFMDPDPRSKGIASKDNTGYVNPEITKLLDKAASLSDPIERGKLYSEAWNTYLNEGTVMIAVMAAPYVVAMSKRLHGFPMFPEQQQRWESAWMD